MRFLCFLCFAAAMVSLKPVQAARVLPFDVRVNGQAAMSFSSGDQGELDEAEVWAKLLEEAVFGNTETDFALSPDETNGSRITLRGEIELRMKYGGQPVRRIVRRF